MCPARPAHAPAGRRTFPASVVGMRSTMQEIPLNVARILEYGRTIHANTKVTSWGPDGPETQTFADVGARAAALAHALRDELGIDGDQRVGTLLYNCAEHLEVFLGVSAMGAVFQPLNQQLMDDQIVHIINHAHDEVIIADPALAGRALVAGSDRGDVVQVLARVFASGGTAVLVTGADEDDPAVADLAATERTTLTL